MSSFKYQLSSRPGPITVEDYRVRARRALPDMVWAYIDYGSEEMQTLRGNREAFARYRLRARVLTGNEGRDLGVQVAGQSLSLPLLLAPTGLAGLAHWTGERAAAQAAERAGTLAIVSTGSSYSFEEISAATERSHFFQLYPWADLATGRHDFTLTLIERAKRAGYQAMVVTVDVPVSGNRESERRRGMGKTPVITPARALSASIRPAWWWTFLRHRRFSMRNLVDAGGAKAAVASVERQLTMTRPELNWTDFAWMREQWDGPLFIKGVLDPDDAERAVELGATGVIVSNHGGRQLDGALASLDALPAIIGRVGDRAEVLLDGGIRRGSDIVKALCLGARAVAIGRPYLYGLAAAGGVGVESVIEIFREEMVRTLTLMGVASVRDLGPQWLLSADASTSDHLQ